MANELDEMTAVENTNGRDTFVNEKQLPQQTGIGTILFIVLLFALGIIPGIIFFVLYVKEKNFLEVQQQKIQGLASEIDIAIENRVIILQDVAKLVSTAVNLDTNVMTDVAKFRGGAGNSSSQASADEQRNELYQRVDNGFRGLTMAFENYPELQAHESIQQALRQNSLLQKEIAATRSLYNNAVFSWNAEVVKWPVGMFVASKKGFTTRIPFSTSRDTKDRARQSFF